MAGSEGQPRRSRKTTLGPNLAVLALAISAALMVVESPAARAAQRCLGHKATIARGAAGNRITGTKGPDVIQAGAGNDRINGGRGNDLICGGPGRDAIVGGRGRDNMRGGRGSDRLRGGRGSDRLAGGAGRDRLFGMSGNDRLRGGGGADLVDGAAATTRSCTAAPGASTT